MPEQNKSWSLWLQSGRISGLCALGSLIAIIATDNYLREAKLGGFQTRGGFPLFSGKVQIVSWTLSGLFLVGSLNRPRKRKMTNRENPRTIPEQFGKIPEKSGKSQKGQKMTKKEGQVQIGKPPRLKPPRLAALELSHFRSHIDNRKSFRTTNHFSFLYHRTIAIAEFQVDLSQIYRL